MSKISRKIQTLNFSSKNHLVDSLMNEDGGSLDFFERYELISRFLETDQTNSSVNSTSNTNSSIVVDSSNMTSELINKTE
jgi:hypothetical protein